MHFLTTFELQPGVDGTEVQMRIAGDTPSDRSMLTGVLPMFEPIFAANAATLRELVAADVGTRMREAPAEPSLPCPRPDGDFADLPPVAVVA